MSMPGDEDQNGGDAGEALDTAAQLNLTDDDDALPWLAADDEDDEVGGGTDYRILVFAVLALVVLAGLLYGARTLFSGTDQAEVVADGSTIEAPDAPYRERRFARRPAGQRRRGRPFG